MSALLSSLLTEVTKSHFTDEQERETEKNKILSRLLLSDWKDSVQHIAPMIFKMIGHEDLSQKLQGWRFLTVLLQSGHRCESYVVKPLCQFIDKHALVRSIKGTVATSQTGMDTICQGLKCILALAIDVNDVSTSIDTQLGKIISACSDLMTDPAGNIPGASFAMQIMLMIITAKGRLCTPQQLHRCITSCFYCLPLSRLYRPAANLIGVCAANASSEIFDKLWKSLAAECTRLLQILGLGSSRDIKTTLSGGGGHQHHSKPNKSSCDNFDNLQLDVDVVRSSGESLLGVRKAMFIEASYRGLCATLEFLAQFGNVSGPIAQDFHNDIAISLQSAIRYRIAIKESDPEFTIQNEGSLSPAHISVVCPLISGHALSLLSVLLSTVGPSPFLFALADVACSSISTALSRTFPNKTIESVDCSATFTSCAIKGLNCLGYIIRCFPTLLISKYGHIIQKFVDLFCDQMEYLSTDPQCLTENVIACPLFTNKDLIITSLDTCEVLLLTASSLLPFGVREQLERSVHVSLRCLVKGVILPAYTSLVENGHNFTPCRMLKQSQLNKKVRRMQCEALRSDVHIQKGFLLVSYAEVLSYYEDGSRSANLPLLNRAIGVCAVHEVTASVCCRISLGLGSILFPPGVSLPSPPLIDVAQKKILQHTTFVDKSLNRQLPLNTDSLGEENKERATAERNDVNKLDVTENLRKRDRSALESSSPVKLDISSGHAETSQLHAHDKADTLSQSKWFQPNADITETKNPAQENPIQRETSDDSDLDELPEINIDAEVDC